MQAMPHRGSRAGELIYQKLNNQKLINQNLQTDLIDILPECRPARAQELTNQKLVNQNPQTDLIDILVASHAPKNLSTGNLL